MGKLGFIKRKVVKDMARMVLGVFTERNDAEDTLYELEGMGYNPKDISIAMKDQGEARGMVKRTGADVVGGTVSGAAAGGVVGALAGLLVATGVAPGLGTIFIGGPLATTLGLTGAAATTVSGAVTGALAGGLVGALVGFGIPRREAEEYEESVRRGGILVIVPTRDGEDREVRDVMEEYGADQVKALDREEREEEVTPRRYHHPEETAYGHAHYHQIRGRGKRKKERLK